jgi:hypothetical protein
MTMFPIILDYVSDYFGLKRGLVVHLGVGIHVVDVAVAVQVHVTKLFQLYQRKLPSTWRHVR